MATVAAELVLPGDKIYVVALAQPDLNKQETWKLGEMIDVSEMQVIRTHIVPATATTPDIICLECRDKDKTKHMLCYTRQQQVTLVPKPGKWTTIWKTLRK